MPRSLHLLVVRSLIALTSLACSTRLGMISSAGEDPAEDDAVDAADAGESLVAAEQIPVEGTLDRARDPALVLLRSPHSTCSATFVAKDVVVTARVCVQDAGASELTLHVSDEPADEPPAARGLEVLLSNGDVSEPGIAFVVLDADFPTQRPLGLRASSVAAGTRLRAAGHVDQGASFAFGTRVVREHVYVRGESDRFFYLSELGCRFLPGGPAIDPSNGQLIGILVGHGDRCDGEGASNQYLRLEPYADAFDRALARSGLFAERDDSGAVPADAKPRGASRPGTKKPPTDVGASCAGGGDCATGVCMVHLTTADDGEPLQERAYCSRACGRGDRCPTNYRCTVVRGATSSMCVVAP